MSRRFSVLLLVLACLAAAARAQSVRWEPSGGSLAVGQTTELSLIFVDCEPAAEVTLPALPGLTVGRPARGEQTSLNIVNGQTNRTRTVFLTYSVLPTIKAPLEIPAFTVQTDKGALRVPAVSFQVGDATVGGNAMPLDSAANSRLAVGEGTAWAGQVLPVDYTLSVTNRFPANIGSNPDWNAGPLVHEEWAQPEPFNSVVNGEQRNNVLYKTRGYIREPGTHALEPVNQLVNLRVPSSGFSIFQSFQAEQFNITSNRPTVVVRPLPQPAPAGFAGAVGDFKLVSKVVPESAGVGEPITWTLELTGTGNWPDVAGLPAREASRDFRVVQPQAKRTQPEGKLFDATLSEDVVLIPTKPGSYTLGPVAWTYFDPVSGTYKNLTTERIVVTVTAPAADPLATAPAGTTPAAASPAAPAVDLAAPPAAPAAIPLDPLAGSALGRAPLAGGSLTAAIAAAVAWVPLLWLGLAVVRARRADPWRERREARARLARTLASLRAAASPAARSAALGAWRRDTAVLCGIGRATPTARDFRGAPDWAKLWEEAERCSYGMEITLPADWTARAEAALAAKRVPGFSPASAFLPRNLLPFVAVLMLATSPLGGADTGVAAYGRSEFAAAEKAWRDALANQPRDWIARHNLALALAQQDRWGEAAAHATAAFAQNPAHPSVRWHFDLTLARAGYTPPDLGSFARPDVIGRLARLLSPAGWQFVLMGAAALVGVAAALLLFRAYGHAPRWLTAPAAICVLAALVATTAALVSLERYGLAKDARAALVWHTTVLRSIPTEADTAQKTTPLPAGSLAVVDRSFLGWIRLAFPDGQTGWVRSEDVVRLYR